MKEQLKAPIMIFSVFLIIAIILSYLTEEIFLLFNFLYIGSFISIGIYLFNTNNKYSRNIVQIAVGSYLLIYVGLILNNNILISGFFYYLLIGVFQAAVIHFLIAKILGPLIFGRGWCGYACWTAMILDILPYKTPKTHIRRKNLGYLRYALFILIVTSVLILLYYLKTPNLDNLMFLLFIVGNIIYYIVGIILAYLFKDNRAFCKYVCPICTFLKPASYLSILRVKVNLEKCNKCNACVEICPMDVDILDSKRNRKNGTECIMCLECVKLCPTNCIKM
ncbi:4Fe-4S binding protein [Methanobrevibacter filiformis]|uniref:Putative electron transport protein YccM n=1 Tax=Methanobrevibacter filiformis TaxID=55758 RepID=A0A166C679_9EURY|nr:4Fe-4S binding protein [Methanobrevibacter filiformis]KZX11577.1 putative electron transport protein YccM [Methanobrevibacter filiformis]